MSGDFIERRFFEPISSPKDEAELVAVELLVTDRAGSASRLRAGLEILLSGMQTQEDRTLNDDSKET